MQNILDEVVMMELKKQPNSKQILDMQLEINTHKNVSKPTNLNENFNKT